MSAVIKTAVVGVGYLGGYHAEKFAFLPESDLVAVVDVDFARAQLVAGRLGVKACTDYHEIIDAIDAVSIAVPTQAHFAVARDFLRHGKSVLLEKPMTTTLAEADELIRLADETGAVLQIGHLERFNPVVTALEGILTDVRFIESIRIAPFKPRCTDVNVVLDLMIHDIDIIQHLVKSPIEHIDSIGAPVFTGEEDIANARIKFANGCVANVTASRISLKSERRMRLFQADAYISLDFQNKNVAVFRKGTGELSPGVPNVVVDQQKMADCDVLQMEIASFLAAAAGKITPVVSGTDGRRALETALRINKKL
jgi:predicted dehydrogenase